MNFKILLITTLTVCAVMCACKSKSEPYHDKVAQMIMVGFNGYTLDKDNPIYDAIQNSHIGGVILFNRNVKDPDIPKNIRDYAQVKKLIADLQSISPTPLFVAVDQEGGRVARLGPEFGVSDKSAWALGQANDLNQTRTEATKTATVLHDLGFNVNFAPCVDVMLNPDSPIIAKPERSFSADPEMVAKHAEQFIQVYQNAGVLPVLKHFPGHGSAKGDTHEGYVDITDDYQETELIPYQTLLSKYPHVGVMVAHVFNKKVDNKWPLSLSYNNVTGTLRNDLNFTGPVFSDDLQMGALTKQHSWHDIVVNAINAGTDVLVIGNNLNYDSDIAEKTIDIILQAIKNNEIKPETIDAAYQRIMAVKSKN